MLRTLVLLIEVYLFPEHLGRGNSIIRNIAFSIKGL